MPSGNLANGLPDVSGSESFITSFEARSHTIIEIG